MALTIIIFLSVIALLYFPFLIENIIIILLSAFTILSGVCIIIGIVLGLIFLASLTHNVLSATLCTAALIWLGYAIYKGVRK